MELKEMAEEYRKSGDRCRERLAELRRRLPEKMPETRRLELRRRITVLEDMERETVATANYLAHYYDRRTWFRGISSDESVRDGVQPYAQPDAPAARGGRHDRKAAEQRA